MSSLLRVASASRPVPSLGRSVSRSFSPGRSFASTSSEVLGTRLNERPRLARIQHADASTLYASALSTLPRLASSSSHVRQASSRRSMSTSMPRSASKYPFTFLTGYSFAGKVFAEPQSDVEGEIEGDEASSSKQKKKKAAAPVVKKQGFPEDSEIGRWRETLLRGGHAGEDSLMCARMGVGKEGESVQESGDVVIGVADGVGGWSENGIDPALFSQSLMYHATKHAEKFYACPNRLDDEDLVDDGASSSIASSSTSSASSSRSSTPSTPGTTPPSSPGPEGNGKPRVVAEEQDPASSYPGSPVSILSAAYEATLKQPDVIAGSSTACIITLDASKGILRSANLGDSGFMVLRQGASIPSSPTDAVRPGERPVPHFNNEHGTGAGQPGGDMAGGPKPRMVDGLLYASAPLQHGFNTPLQLAKLPEEWRQEGSIDSSPRDAATTQGQLRSGDLIVVGTDGFFDNVSQTETVAVVRYVREKHHQAWSEQRKKDGLKVEDLDEERDLVQVIAHNLASYATMCMNSSKSSPFEREAARYGLMYPGGKVDDVAVVCALIVEQ